MTQHVAIIVLAGFTVLANLALAKECGTRPDLNLGIYFGELARKAEFPWQISLHRNGEHICGGSILSDNWIITAAHCVVFGGHLQPADRYSALIGSLNQTLKSSQNNTKLIGAKRIVAYPNFTSPFMSDDIALIELLEPIGLDKAGHNINSICLGKAEDIIVGKEVVISGWGYTEDSPGQLPDMLRKATILVESQQKCKELHSIKIYDGEVCTTSKPDTCQGDSGGPLQYSDKDGRWYLMGLTSWGAGCGTGIRPAVYTRVPYYRNFIREVTGL